MTKNKILDELKTSELNKGFKLSELFSLVSDTQKKAKNGDQQSKIVIKTANELWGTSSKYAF
jgi:hypothetical protein